MMTRAEKIELIQLRQEKLARLKASTLSRAYAKLYPWQHKFNASTAEYTACLLMAANQVGKALTACIIDAYHLPGDYPADWAGHRFGHAPMCWLLGYSGEKTRDLLQEKLFGRL